MMGVAGRLCRRDAELNRDMGGVGIHHFNLQMAIMVLLIILSVPPTTAGNFIGRYPIEVRRIQKRQSLLLKECTRRL